MNISAEDFLTDAQKGEIGTAIYKKILGSIAITKVEPLHFDVNDILKDELEEIFKNGDVYECVDFEKIGKELTGIITKAIKGK